MASLQTITLSNNNNKSSNNNNNNNNLVAVTPEEIIPTVTLSMEDFIQDLDGSSSARLMLPSPGVPITVKSVDCVASQPLIQHIDSPRQRPAFISATVDKESKGTSLGLGFRKVNGVLQVSSLRPGCLLSEAPFQVGDQLISINNVSCASMSLSSVARMLKKVTGLLTVVVEHPQGDPKLVESMVMKATPSSKTGLGVCRGKQVSVSSIHPKSPFAASLLSPRDRILAINGWDCRFLRAPQAAEIITKATNTVTIVAKKGMDNAAVVTFAASE